MVTEHTLYKQIASLQQEVRTLKEGQDSSKSAAFDAMESQRAIETLEEANADLREQLAASQNAAKAATKKRKKLF